MSPSSILPVEKLTLLKTHKVNASADKKVISMFCIHVDFRLFYGLHIKSFELFEFWQNTFINVYFPSRTPL